MSVKYEVTVTAIGKLARKFLETNSSVILLDEGAHPNLVEMVIEHTPSELASRSIRSCASVRTQTIRSAKAGTAPSSSTQRAPCPDRSNLRARQFPRSRKVSNFPLQGNNDNAAVRVSRSVLAEADSFLYIGNH